MTLGRMLNDVAVRGKIKGIFLNSKKKQSNTAGCGRSIYFGSNTCRVTVHAVRYNLVGPFFRLIAKLSYIYVLSVTVCRLWKRLQMS